MEIYRPSFEYTVEVVGIDGKVRSTQKKKNIMPTEMLNHILNAVFKSGSTYATFYLGLFENNWTPSASDTMTTLIASAGENVDYTGTQRMTISFPSVSAGALTTSASPNEFAFTSAETIRGAFISTTATWSSTTGILASAVLFSSSETLASGETLRVPLGFTLTNS